MASSVKRVIQDCRSCGFKNLTPIFSLGELYVSDFVAPGDAYEGVRAPLELVLCNHKDGGCGLLQLKHTVNPEALYRNYWYKSGVNKTMTDELVGIAQKTAKMVGLKGGDFVIDIGANDGTLLRGYNVSGLKTVGFEPAKNLTQHAEEGTTKIMVDFFNKESWQKEFGDAKAKAITAIAMFYDLDDPNKFVSDVISSLDDEGIFIVQIFYLPSMLRRNAFDGIFSEHLEYYSLMAIENLLGRNGLEIFDYEMREHINEGSIRLYIRKTGKGEPLQIPEGGVERIAELRKEEERLGLGDKQVYEDFGKRISEEKRKSMEFIKREVAKGKKIHGYAASTKGNTTLQFFGLTPNLIEAIADRNPAKWGKINVGTKIPVISEEESRAQKPDYYFILAWHFLPEFLEREKEYLKSGGKFIVPLPEFKIIGEHGPE